LYEPRELGITASVFTVGERRQYIRGAAEEVTEGVHIVDIAVTGSEVILHVCKNPARRLDSNGSFNYRLISNPIIITHSVV
jgi:hypothetical protein